MQPAPVVLSVSGVPSDTTVREISHIFRHFTGFRKAWAGDMIGDSPSYFVEFETYSQAKSAARTKQVRRDSLAAPTHWWQGYIIDLNEPDIKLVVEIIPSA